MAAIGFPSVIGYCSLYMKGEDTDGPYYELIQKVACLILVEGQCGCMISEDLVAGRLYALRLEEKFQIRGWREPFIEFSISCEKPPDTRFMIFIGSCRERPLSLELNNDVTLVDSSGMVTYACP